MFWIVSRGQLRAISGQIVSLGQEALLSTGEMARRSGATLRTVRFYEAEGLIRANDRDGGGHRDDSFPECCKTCEVTEQPDAQRVMHLLWKN